MVSRSPSDLEVVLGVIKGFSKSKLGRDGVSSAGKQLLLLEGLMLSKQKKMLSKQNGKLNDDRDNQSEGGDSDNCASNTTGKNVNLEPCPICHENLGDQKMVFQCGHVTCCKCYVELKEQAVVSSGKFQQKRVMCPTCRQHTDFGNVAYVDDRKGEVCDKTVLHLFQGHEMSIKVEGSYGTKIEAVIKRILWIGSIDQEAKLLVFSSWNDVLDVLEHSFRANDISYVRMKGGRKSQVAVAQFKGQREQQWC